MSSSQNLSTDQVAALAELAKRNLSKSLHSFMKAAWRQVEPETEFKDGWHLHAICEHLEAVASGQIRNLVINIPPRHCKSLLCGTFWPTWVWITDPSKKWLCSSYSYGLSVRDSLRARKLVESRWFKLRFPEVAISSELNTQARYATTAGGYRIATTVLGSATGEGGDYIVVDDAHKVMEAQSDLARQRVIDWWDQTMSTRGNDPSTVAKVVIGQRVHEHDICGHLQQREDYEHLILPAEWDGEIRQTGIGWREPRKELGEILWPERFGKAEILEIKQSLGSYASAAQLQQRPAPREGGMIKEEWIQRYSKPPKMERIIQSWDTAFKAGVGSYVVGQVWGVSEKRYYLIHQERDRWGFTKTVEAIKRIAKAYPDCNEVLIEDAANGPAIIETLKSTIDGLIPVKPDGSKQARLSAVTPLFEAGQVFIPEGKDWLIDFESELLTFPFSRHDDQVDAASMALRRLSKGGCAAIFAPRKRILR